LQCNEIGLFERFLSEEGNTTPDIDLDISTAHRDQVIEYIYETYGEEHTAMVCNVVTCRTRSAIRDVGKVLGFPPGVVDQMARAIDPHSDALLEDQLTAVWEGENGEGKGEEGSPSSTLHPPSSLFQYRDRVRSGSWKTFLRLVREIQGVPRHLSIHNGGMVITACPLVDIVPLERATMPGRVVTQWNKDSM